MNNLAYIFEAILNENPNQAIKFLKDKNLDPTITPKGKQILDAINNITRGDGYTFLLTKLYLNSRVPIQDLTKLHQYIKSNKDYLSRLPQPIFNYDNYRQLKTDINRLEDQRELKKFLNSIGTELSQQVNGMSKQWILNLTTLVKKFYLLKPDQQKHFLKKVFGFKDITVFRQQLFSYITAIQNKQDYTSVSEKVSSTPDTQIVLQDPEKEIIIAHIMSFEACKTLGCTANWCIARDISRYKEYKAGGNYYFFIWDFNYPVNDPNFFIATAYNPEDPNMSKTHEHIDDTRVNLLDIEQQKQIDPNIFINYIDDYNEARKQSFQSTGGLALALKDDDIDGIVDIINNSQIAQEYKINPKASIWTHGDIDLQIKKEQMIEMLELGEAYDYILSVSSDYSYSGDHYGNDDENYMHQGLNDHNIEALKNLAKKMGLPPKYYNEFSDKENKIKEFLEKYGMGDIVNEYASDYGSARDDAEQREAKSQISKVPFDVGDGSFRVPIMFKYYIDNDLTAENFDQLIQQIKEKLPDFSYESINNAGYEDIDLDSLNQNFANNLEKYESDIEVNEDNEFYNIFKAMRDGSEYLSQLGFKILDDSEDIAMYSDKKNRKSITVNTLEYQEDDEDNPFIMATATLTDTSKPSSVATKRKIRVPITSLKNYIGQRVLKLYEMMNELFEHHKE